MYLCNNYLPPLDLDCVTGEAQRLDLGNRGEDSPCCLRVRMNLDNQMIIDGLAGHRVIFTVAILSTTLLNFSNVFRNEENQSTRTIGLSVPVPADATLWMGSATVPISELAFFAASSSRAGSTAVTSGVSKVSWFIREYSGKDWTQNSRGPWAATYQL